MDKMKKLLFLILFLTAGGCGGTDATLSSADYELPFHVLQPESLSEEWAAKETIYDENLVILTYEHKEKGTIELIQDQQIQGLNKEELRLYMNEGAWPVSAKIDGNSQTLMIDDYVGEWSAFPEADQHLQYTFVRQFDLYAEPQQGMPYYQVIGRDVSSSDIINFVESLEMING
ncbi:hypothetical protein C6Y45_08605 [Alkalicoccus saliphilus]|uniref:DUF4367 domain-containing protein n=2 Tax=Alkalicoccus saliphilus TaxID=200989 RepID=A0A2T4U6K3_9BACI|nr:hypothetical protein C6Y45_08605 [Alkalicoccus saliphilus]